MTEMLEARNPRTGKIDYRVAVTGQIELDGRVQRLRAAQPAWVDLSVTERAAVLRRWHAAMQRQTDALVDALTRDTGRLHESRLEVDAVLAGLARWIEEAPELLADGASRPGNIPFIETRQTARPYALVGIISPWNFPLLLSVIDAIPALLAGAAVVIKPSEVTPRFVEVVEQTLAQVPELAEVQAWVIGGGKTGAALVERVDLVCFTGSVATGRRVGEAAAARFIPAFLELGGKDAAIVLEDADIARTARALTWGSMVNGGQSCMSIERVYVVEAVHEALINALVEQIGSLRLNTSDVASGQIGPIIAAAQIDILQAHLDDARARGARFLTGGQLIQGEDGGFWCQPTLLTDVTHEMKVVREETFGAILPVMAVADEAEAVARANDSIYGLSAAVFSADRARALAVARRLEAGAISINDAALTSLIHSAEKQSFKQSGLGGSRMGPGSIRRFLRQQCFLINPGVEDPWWFESG